METIIPQRSVHVRERANHGEVGGSDPKHLERTRKQKNFDQKPQVDDERMGPRKDGRGFREHRVACSKWLARGRAEKPIAFSLCFWVLSP